MYIYLLEDNTQKHIVAQDAAINAANKHLIFNNYVAFINCIKGIKNAQVDDAHDIDVAMPMYNLIEYSDIYSKKIWNFIAVL